MKQAVQIGVVLALILLGMGLLVAALAKLAAFLLLVLIAIVLTTSIDPIVCSVQRLSIKGRRLPRVAATLLVLFGGLCMLAGVAVFLAVTAVHEGIRFAQETWPVLLQDRLIPWAEKLAAQYPVLPDPETIYERLGQQSERIAGYLWSTTRAVFGFIGGIFSVITVFILTLFFTTFKTGITYTFAQLIPPQYQARVLEISHLAGRKMGCWLRGQLILALIVFASTALAMKLLGMPYAMIIAIVAGIGELIPMIGPVLGFFFAMLVLLTKSGDMLLPAVATAAFFLVLSQVENYVLAPKIMEREVELSPITTIMALLVGGSLLGVVGALLAIPVAAAGRIVLLEAVFPAIQGKSRAEIAAGAPGVNVPAPPCPESNRPPDTTTQAKNRRRRQKAAP
jgi:predicted PurR-regulated permease PerM